MSDIKRSRVLLLLSAFALALAIVPASAVLAAGGAASKPIADITVLFGRAVKKIRNTSRPTYSRAVVFEADGFTRGGTCTPMGCFGGRAVKTAAGVVGWRRPFSTSRSVTRSDRRG